jgi:hypothetical protein
MRTSLNKGRRGRTSLMKSTMHFALQRIRHTDIDINADFFRRNPNG